MRENRTGVSIVAAALTLVAPASARAQLDRSQAQILVQPSTPWGANDRFGEALASGDFNGDGFADLAVAIPFREAPGGSVPTGAVQVYCGTPTGLQIHGESNLYQGGPGVSGVSENGDRFGGSLAVGDFNGDGRDDLAIGVPYENAAGVADSGAVHVLAGRVVACPGPERLFDGSRVIWQGQPGIADAAESWDRFGTQLAAGDFDGNGYDDLAVGVHFEDVGGVRDAGAVHVFRGSSRGLGTADTLYHRGQPGMGGAAERDRFGRSVLAADFNLDGFDELVVGVPGWNEARGLVQVLPGSGSGPVMALQYEIREQFRLIEGAPGYVYGRGASPGDQFGWALAAGVLSLGTGVDVAVGAPFDDRGRTMQNVGMVQLLYRDENGVPRYDHFEPEGLMYRAEDRHGESLAVGDFDGDGLEDLVVGSPQAGSAGQVFILSRGLSSAGLFPFTDYLFAADFPTPRGEVATGARFGQALAVGDFDGDGLDDVAIGSPDESVARVIGRFPRVLEREGRVVVLFGERP